MSRTAVSLPSYPTAPMATVVAKTMTPIFPCSLTRSESTGDLKNAYSQRGFTLLELILVMGIIALAAALVSPNLTGLDSRNFDAQIRELAAQLNYARRDAIVSGQISTIELHDQNYNGVDADLDNTEADSQANVANRWSSDSISLAVSANDARENVYDAIDSLAVSFYPEGGASGVNLRLSQDNQSAWFVIDPFTGRITVSRDDDL